jgi:putative oxidoreductase
VRRNSPFLGFSRPRTLVSYCGVQRLFSTFPNSWPGLGLVILRLATGFSLAAAAHATGDLANTAHLLERCLIDSIVVLLWIGFWTPIAALTAAVIQIAIMVLGQRLDSSSAVAAALGLALAMLGPGAWSLDARLFGRKRIV